MAEGEKKPLAALAVQHHQKHNENVEFLPEVKDHEKPNHPIKVLDTAQALHLLNGTNPKKCESTYYVGLSKRVGESSCSQRNETFLISIGKKLVATFRLLL